MNQNFGGLVWTSHALEKLKERGIKQGDAWATWKNPQQKRYAANRGAWICSRTYGNKKIEVVAKQNDKKEWIILSVWSRPVDKIKKKSQSLISLLVKRVFNQ